MQRLALTILLVFLCTLVGSSVDLSSAGSGRVVHVSTPAQLRKALAAALPGDDIVLADGVYEGRFAVQASRSGTEGKRVTLRGSRAAVLDGGDVNTGYVLHLKASYWEVKGISITNGLKGIMADGVTGVLIDSVKLWSIGEEAIHLRQFSSHNRIERCEISGTGLKTPGFGEGIYIGSAKNNWEKHSVGGPDRCDSNVIAYCRIGPSVAAECIDIKEGTTGGLIRGNHFDATGITGANSADSWMDIKGNGYLIEGNTGYNPEGSMLRDGFQVNVAFPGWGNGNLFIKNDCTINAGGYGILVKLKSSNGEAKDNRVFESNRVKGAGQGLTNIPPAR